MKTGIYEEDSNKRNHDTSIAQYLFLFKLPGQSKNVTLDIHHNCVELMLTMLFKRDFLFTLFIAMDCNNKINSLLCVYVLMVTKKVHVYVYTDM